MIKKLAFLEVVVEDFNQALEWYTNILGFTISGEIVKNSDGLWCQLETETKDDRLALWKPNWTLSQDRECYFFIPVFEVKNLVEFVAELKEKGVVFLEDIRETPRYHITTFIDPEGNRLQLFMFV